MANNKSFIIEQKNQPVPIFFVNFCQMSDNFNERQMSIDKLVWKYTKTELEWSS